MKKNKNLFQKVSLVSGVVSFVLAVVCVVIFYIKLDDLGFNHPISASLLASIFFFVFVGVVLFSIGKSDMPSLKVGASSQDNNKES